MEGSFIHYKNGLWFWPSATVRKELLNKVFKDTAIRRSPEIRVLEESHLVCRQAGFDIVGHGGTEQFEQALHQEETNQFV